MCITIVIQMNLIGKKSTFIAVVVLYPVNLVGMLQVEIHSKLRKNLEHISFLHRSPWHDRWQISAILTMHSIHETIATRSKSILAGVILNHNSKFSLYQRCSKSQKYMLNEFGNYIKYHLAISQCKSVCDFYCRWVPNMHTKSTACTPCCLLSNFTFEVLRSHKHEGWLFLFQ